MRICGELVLAREGLGVRLKVIPNSINNNSTITVIDKKSELLIMQMIKVN